MGAIVGVGVDVVDVKRMKVVLDARGTSLIKKLFTESEIAYLCVKKELARALRCEICGERSCQQGNANRVEREIPMA